MSLFSKLYKRSDSTGCNSSFCFLPEEAAAGDSALDSGERRREVSRDLEVIKVKKNQKRFVTKEEIKPTIRPHLHSFPLLSYAKAIIAHTPFQATRPWGPGDTKQFLLNYCTE